jgi:chromosomal replication initiator protein
MYNESLQLNVEEAWENIRLELQKILSPDAFKRWFEPLRPLRIEGGRFVFGIENSIYRYWIQENYLEELKACIRFVMNRDLEAAFEMEEAERDDHPHVSSGVKAADGTVQFAVKENARESESPDTGIDARYTFDNFIVGINSQFAHAAALAVADAPARTYNPLFIHGQVGLGKTHLMLAIGNRIRERKKGSRIVYVTSESFTNEFITAIQRNEIQKFRKRYRNADALLIDDVQFFAGKERSQEEFFHTFNALFNGNKQIVLSSDSPPADVQIEQRLISRFEWGLTAELQPPDIETRLAILRSKADKMQVRFSDDILLFIAERIKANVRRLEGALTRVAALAAVQGKPINQQQVEDLLSDLIQQESRTAVTVELIQKRVAETYDLRLTDMTSKRRPNNIAIPRMIAMYLSRKMTGKSLQEIGDSFGGRDHGTVLHACRAIEQRMEKDGTFRHQVSSLTQKLEVAGIR